jgi:hypothetical protein
VSRIRSQPFAVTNLARAAIPVHASSLPFLKAVQNELDSRRNPQFFKRLGTGSLRTVSIGCFATLALNLFCGYIGGRYAQPFGLGAFAVVCSAALSLAAGYAIIIAAYHRENRIPLSDLLPDESARIFLISLASALILAGALFSSAAGLASSQIYVAGIIVLLAAILFSMWIHPMRFRLVR